ncbi:sugar phosphate isomerase/epimerase [candidate division WOR-3 bacterium]|nr:sugar phosphate isomerase/epimerase [candidate division WOR-3 bacterium]
MYKIGYQALFDFEDAFHAVEFGIEKGFQCVELNQTATNFSPEKYSPVQRKRLKNYEFPILIHAPQDVSLFNLNKKALDGTIAQLYEIIDFAHEISARTITLHLGSTFPISTGGKMLWTHHIMPQEFARVLEYALLKLIEYANHRVFLCVENTSGFRYKISQPIVAKLLSTQDLHLTWDIGHTNTLKSHKDLVSKPQEICPLPFHTNREKEEKFFLKFLNKVREVHLHDNNGDWDEHGIIGTGTVDFKHYFEILKPIDPYFILEVRPKERALESFKAIKNLPLFKV